jgi:hypothetical protein
MYAVMFVWTTEYRRDRSTVCMSSGFKQDGRLDGRREQARAIKGTQTETDKLPPMYGPEMINDTAVVTENDDCSQWNDPGASVLVRHS